MNHVRAKLGFGLIEFFANFSERRVGSVRQILADHGHGADLALQERNGGIGGQRDAGGDEVAFHGGPFQVGSVDGVVPHQFAHRRYAADDPRRNDRCHNHGNGFAGDLRRTWQIGTDLHGAIVVICQSPDKSGQRL